MRTLSTIITSACVGLIASSVVYFLLHLHYKNSINKAQHLQFSKNDHVNSPDEEKDSNDREDPDDLEDFDTQDQPSREIHKQARINKRLTRKGPGPSIEQHVKNTVPGSQSIFVKSFGCSHNSSDTEYMLGLLNEYGYNFSQDVASADLVLINSCTVKNPSQDTVTSLISKAKVMNKPIVVAGCIPQADRTLSAFEGISLLGVTQIDRIVEIVEHTLNGNIIRLLSKKSLPSLDLPKIRRNPLVEIIPLSTGCLGACTYCKTRHARGKLGSYKPEAILMQVDKAAREGVQQIWLTSEDTGAYGLDIDTNIVDLLSSIVDTLPPHIMLRLGMTNPPYILEHLSSIGEILKHPRVFEFIHIPVQSGSNNTLKHMVREYTREEFELTADQLLKIVPNLTIATDIICGFPTETEEDHQLTLDLIKKYKFPVLNISQFYPRPGTPAAQMKRVPTQIVKQRSREVTNLFESYHSLDFLVNSIQMVWFSEFSEKSDHIVGHTKQYVKVLVPRDELMLGKSSPVKILQAHKWHLVGKIL